jgi:hypothetical protein
MALEVAKEEVLKHKAYRKKIKNYAPDKATVSAALVDAYARIEKTDAQKKAEATARGNGYLPLILSAKQGVRLGTKKVLTNLLKHVDRGCCEDPFGIDEVNVALDPDAEYPDYVRIRGTSQGESSNRLINVLTNEIGRQTAETADKQLWLRVTRYNLRKDKTMQKVLGLKKIRSMEWFLHQALLSEHPNLSIYNDQEFPAEPADYFEPIGVQYGRHKE